MELTALQRFFTAITAQVGGIGLFLIIGLLPFSNSQTNIAVGVQWIIYAMAVTSAALLLGVIVAGKRAIRLEGIDHVCVNWTITIFLVVDIPVVLFLVCQEGGLCRSIFIPLYFLIPIALMIVEPHDQWRRVYRVLFSICICITLSYAVSWYVGVPEESKITELPLLYGKALKLTFFDQASHPGYDVSMFIVSLVSVLIPIGQKFTIGLVTKIVRN